MAGRRCAEWRFPTAKQQRIEDTAKKIADAQRARDPASDHDAWWDAVLADPRAETTRPTPARTLGEIRSDRLRVECLRRFRIVEIARADAIARFDVGSEWKYVATHVLADGCQHRTGRHEEDGCWPDFR